MAASSPIVTFFTTCDATYFPGLVALLNSLRLMGHSDELVVADCGLFGWQRDLLERYCTIFDLPDLLVSNPTQLKAFPSLVDRPGVSVLIDCDIIVCRSLSEIIRQAGCGQICAYPDPEQDRWFAEWTDIFGLHLPLRRQPYVCSGLVAFARYSWPKLLGHWWELCGRIGTEPTYKEGVSNTPTSQSDQDALNALLMSECPATAIALQPPGEQIMRWEFRSLQIIDAGTLRCHSALGEPRILHACLGRKPWLRHGVRRNAYFELLRRLISAPDIALKVPKERLPLWLRPGSAAEFTCSVLSVANMFNPDDGILPAPALAAARGFKRRMRAVRGEGSVSSRAMRSWVAGRGSRE